MFFTWLHVHTYCTIKVNKNIRLYKIYFVNWCDLVFFSTLIHCIFSKANGAKNRLLFNSARLYMSLVTYESFQKIIDILILNIVDFLWNKRCTFCRACASMCKVFSAKFGSSGDRIEKIGEALEETCLQTFAWCYPKPRRSNTQKSEGFDGFGPLGFQHVSIDIFDI